VVTAAVDFEIRGDARMPDGRCILYVASGNPINVKGLRDFLKFAWPTISKLVAEAELIVAGQVGAAIDVLPSRVQVLGVVPDLENAYRGARVVINPALAGTGYKIKTVEALTHLRPIVTWPAGVDGLPFELESLCDVARDWYEFASRVVARLTCDGQETFSPAEQEVIRRATSPDLVYQELVPSLCAMWDERRVGGKHARSPHLH
jgi:hypothetical protein